jgi:phosphate uptake regulator
LEVIEETSNYLTIKNFINVDEFIVPDLLRRSDIIIRSMFSDIFECLETEDKKLAEAIIQRDREINRLTFIIYMCLNHINEYPQEAKMHGMEVFLSPHVWELNGYFEKIGDELKRFARLLPDSKLSKKVKEEIKSIFNQVQNFYLDVISSFYKSDIDKADKASGRRKAIFGICNDYLLHSRSPPERGMVSRMIYLISFVNGISRLARYVSIEKHNIVKGQITLAKKKQ